MKSLTQQEIILKHLGECPENWFYSYQLIKVNTKYGWLGSGVDRQARKLAELGKLERKHEGKYAMYRIAKPKQTVVYKIAGTDEVVAQQRIF